MILRHYLDHNATSPLRPQARAAMAAALDEWGNPSSIHAEGRAARALMEEARFIVADALDAARVVFVSGATEALALALRPFWRRGETVGPRRLLIGATEHPAALAGHDFDEAQAIPVGPDGRIDLAALEQALQGPPAMLALQAANSETGVLQPLADAAALVRENEGLFVCDAVQAFGKGVPTGAGLADMLILSAHKIGGPKGVGALVLADEALHCDRPLLRGGGQEQGVRAGTENVAAIAGFGAAAASLDPLEPEAMRRLRDEFERGLLELAPDAVVFGRAAPRLPNVSAFAIPGAKAQTMLMAMDMEGISISSGSACSSGKVKRSAVLDAMGVAPHIAECALRVSLGWNSTLIQINAALKAFEKALNRLKRAGT